MPTPEKDENGEERLAGYWDTRCVSIICRYLNSGFPVLIAGQDHALTLVGWKRDETGNVTFVACDDQVGPYEEIPSPFQHRKAPWQSIMVPLPPKVFLTGEMAESDAHRALMAIWYSSNPELVKELRVGSIQLRSRLKSVQEFKHEIADQTISDEVLRAIRLAHLPHYVWAVEAHQIDLCRRGPCVLATLLFDATSSDHEPRLSVISAPGATAVFRPDGHGEVFSGASDPWNSMLIAH